MTRTLRQACTPESHFVFFVGLQLGQDVFDLSFKDGLVGSVSDGRIFDPGGCICRSRHQAVRAADSVNQDIVDLFPERRQHGRGGAGVDCVIGPSPLARLYIRCDSSLGSSWTADGPLNSQAYERLAWIERLDSV